MRCSFAPQSAVCANVVPLFEESIFPVLLQLAKILPFTEEYCYRKSQHSADRFSKLKRNFTTFQLMHNRIAGMCDNKNKQSIEVFYSHMKLSFHLP